VDALAHHRSTPARAGSHDDKADDDNGSRSLPADTQAGARASFSEARGTDQNRLKTEKNNQKKACCEAKRIRQLTPTGEVTCCFLANRAAGWLHRIVLLSVLSFVLFVAQGPNESDEEEREGHITR
jgi:hypothetical protein